MTADQYKLRGIKISEAKRMKQDEFIKRAREAHGSSYDYSKSVYVNAHTKIEIQCREHGSFTQRPHDHVKGKNGCPICAKSNRGKSKSLSAFNNFLKNISKVHGDKYEYIIESFTGITARMKIKCPIHGIFYQTPEIHRTGAGCQRCGSGPVSNMSQEWLDNINVEQEHREKWIRINGKRFKVDAYDESINMIYEFLGDYWHGNPKVHDQNKINSHNKITFRELYEGTMLRMNTFIDEGYNVTYIWEKDYLDSSSDSSAGQIIR